MSFTNMLEWTSGDSTPVPSGDISLFLIYSIVNVAILDESKKVFDYPDKCIEKK